MNQNCPCKKTKCERHGDCEACRTHHAESKRKRSVACEKNKASMKSSMQRTIDYYNQNALSFMQTTLDVNMTKIHEEFLRRLPEHATILDFGCGSGRDSKLFIDKGYRVDSIDGSRELCRIAGESLGIKVRMMQFSDFRANNTYDGIWACASILHLRRAELEEVLNQLIKALKIGGILYSSFKYGETEGERNGRYFTDFTEESLSEMLGQIENLKIDKIWVTEDARPGRKEEKWVNVIGHK